jgi:hypothetical protein
MAGEWTDIEIERIVADHFAMLADEIAGRTYNKAEHNRALHSAIGRSRGSIEFKHRNLSAVLKLLGQPVVTGYLPAWNYQVALVDAVRRWLDDHPDWMPTPQWRTANSVAEGSTETGKNTLLPNTPQLWFGPPPSQRNEPPPVDPEVIADLGRRYDVAERDARNRALGMAGEELVLHHERSNLISVDREDLAQRVRWTSREDGDGFGYDIASFEPSGKQRLIEVKTTNGWERTPFHISRNECKVAEARRDEWHLVRLYDFARHPRAFTLRPPLEAHLSLAPTSFLAQLH